MNKNIKYKQQLNNDPYFSFENFMFSNLTKIITEEKSCEICKHITTIAFIYKNTTYYTHYECLSLYFFYQFFNSFTPTENSDCESSTFPDKRVVEDSSLSNGLKNPLNSSSYNGRNGVKVEIKENKIVSSGLCGVKGLQGNKASPSTLGAEGSASLIDEKSSSCELDGVAKGSFFNLNNLYTTITSNTDSTSDSSDSMDLDFLNSKNKNPHGCEMNGFDRKICYSCGNNNVYFKCVVGDCSNYIHYNCSGNGNIIIYTNFFVHHSKFYNAPNRAVIPAVEAIFQSYLKKNVLSLKEKLISYRFLLCYEHVNNNIINEIKLQFLFKLHNTQQYQYVNTYLSNALIGTGAPHGITGATTRDSVGGLRLNKKQKIHQHTHKSSVGSKHTTTVTPSVPPSTLDRGSTPGVGLGINNLIYEYNVYKKSNVVKNNKPININNFNILFKYIDTISTDPSDSSPTSNTPSSPAFSSSALNSSNTSSIVDDIKSLLASTTTPAVVEKGDINELKKLLINVEYNVQNLVHIIHQFLYNNGTSSSSQPANKSSSSSQSPRDDELRSKMLLEEEIYNILHKKPKFILLKLYNKFIWMSIVKLFNNINKNEKVVILHYTALSSLEYLYLKYTLNSVHYLSGNRTLLFLFNRYQRTDDLEESKDPVPSEDGFINLYGYNWDINPTLYYTNSYIEHDNGPQTTRLNKSDIDKSIGASTKTMKVGNKVKASDVDNDSESTYSSVRRGVVRSNSVNSNSSDSKLDNSDNFIYNQGVVILKNIDMINKEINHFKKKIEDNIASSNYKYNNLIYKTQFINFYIKLSNILFCYNKFLFSIKKMVLHYNSNTGTARISTGNPHLDKALVHSHSTDEGDMETGLEEHEGKDNENGTENVGARIHKEFCSICLLSELSHKHILLQCQKCYIRVHYNCYNINNTISLTGATDGVKSASNNSNTSGNNTSGTNEKENNIFYCEPCLIEKKFENNYNSAICISCLSSGGAMKMVYTTQNFVSNTSISGNNTSNGTGKWIHLICLTFIMPKMVYNFSSNQFVYVSNPGQNQKGINGNFGNEADIENNMKMCSICGVVGGIQIKCCFNSSSTCNVYDGEDKCCNINFHPLCCLLSGCFIKYSNLNNLNLYKYRLNVNVNESFNNIADDLFQYLILEPLCIKHSIQLHTQKFVSEQCMLRSHAYTHYMYHPDSYKNKKRYISLPIESIYSPVTITKNGPIKSQPRILLNQFFYPPSASGLDRTDVPGSIGLEGLTPSAINGTMPGMRQGIPIMKKYNEPSLISLIYGLPKNLTVDVPKYGINAITQYLSLPQNYKNGLNQSNGCSRDRFNIV